MKTKHFLLIFSIFISTLTFSQDFKVNINRLTEQTQIATDSEDMRIVWWIPAEFWEATFQDDPTVTEEEVNEIIEIFDNHTIIGVVDGKFGIFGNISYKTYTETKNNLTIIDTEGTIYKPIDESKIDDDAMMILEMMGPLLSNMMGTLGENFHFIVFDGKNLKGENLVNPKEKGQFVVKVYEEDFTFRLPLGALLPDKKCPVDDELLSGAWDYCPWHGKKLKK